MKRMLLHALSIAVLSTASTFAKAPQVLSKTTKGKPALKAIDVISFAPQGVLLIGDGQGSQIVAVRTDDLTPSKLLTKAIPAIDAKLAGVIGAKANGIEILDLAVNPASGKAYFAIRKQDDKSYLILTVDGKGKIAEFSLDKVEYARVSLAGDKTSISRVTDVAWADTQLVAAGRSADQFASKIFAIDTPLAHDAKGNVYSAETYHVQHRRWETKAPMSVLVPYRENDRQYVIGAFSCTPVVKYSLDSLKPDAKVKGSSVLELGSGNRPLDMFTYEKNGKPYVLTNTFRFHHKRKAFGPSPYWTVKFEQGILAEKEKVNEKALWRLKGYDPVTDRVQMVEAFHGVRQMDKLDAYHALVLKEEKNGLTLAALALP
jgi:hypothetical protein